jgi:hypothetical protein
MRIFFIFVENYKKMNKVSVFSILFIFSLLVYSCKKEEGVGGTSTIKGKVILHDYDASYQNPVPLEIGPVANEDVYIIYGSDGTVYNDDFKTSFDGTYEFKFLQKGKYKLFAYSKDSSGASIGNPSNKDIPVFLEIEITSNGSTVNAPDLIIINNNAQ